MPREARSFRPTGHRPAQPAPRPPSSERGYTHRWAAFARDFRRRHPLCAHCLARGAYTAAEHVDHVVPVTGPGDPGFWDETNLQPLCRSCHSRKTATEDGGWGHKKKEKQS